MLVHRIGLPALHRWLFVSIACFSGTISFAGAQIVSPDQEACLPAVAELSRPAEVVEESFSFLSAAGVFARDEGQTLAPFQVAFQEYESEQWRLDSLIDGHGLPPVVRGQSPEIQLLGLSDGEMAVEQTSLLSTVTGTKGRLRGDYLTDFDQTDRIGIQWLTQGWLGIGLDTEANYWQRPVANRGQETLWTGDLNLIYNLVPHPRFKLRSGLGAAWTVDDGQAHAGYNVTHGLDVYLLWRAMAIGEIDWGAIDDDKLFRYRLALGLTIGSAEIFTGYESLKLGSERLDGWVNGIAIWY